MPIINRSVRMALACLWLAVPAVAAPVDAPLGPHDPGDPPALDPLPNHRPALPEDVFDGPSRDTMGAITDRLLAPSSGGHLDLRHMLPPRAPAESLRID